MATVVRRVQENVRSEDREVPVFYSKQADTIGVQSTVRSSQSALLLPTLLSRGSAAQMIVGLARERRSIV